MSYLLEDGFDAIFNAYINGHISIERYHELERRYIYETQVLLENSHS